MEKRRALAIGHGDDAALLERNLRHHLAMGAAPIVVATLGNDPEAAEVVRGFSADVFYRPGGGGGEDPFRYFELAARWIEDAFAVDWIGFIDTDEFILTHSGRLHAPAERYDVCAIRRYNAVPYRSESGAIVAPNLDDVGRALVADGSVVIEDAWGAGDMRTAYVDGLDLGAKVVVRRGIAAGITSGAHAVRTDAAFAARAIERDAIIVHFPFTTYERFRRKVDAIRQLLVLFEGRVKPWHWEYWARMDEAQLVAEFERQVFDGSKTDIHTTTAAQLVRDAAPLSERLDWFFASRIVAYDAPPGDARRLRTPSETRVERAFDATAYAALYPDIERAAREPSFDPREHFFRHGIVEGRRPSFAFDPVRVARDLTRRLGSEPAMRDVWWRYFDVPEAERIVPNAWFDARWFEAAYGARENAWSAFAFYLENVAARSLSPNAWFDEARYRELRPAVAAAIEAGSLSSGFAHYLSGLDARLRGSLAGI